MTLNIFQHRQSSPPTDGQRAMFGFLLALVALAYTLPIFHHVGNWGIQDWDQHLFYHGVPRTTILEYHQFPLWNPYYVGGTVLLANPQSRVLAPSFLLILAFGPVAGLKIDIWLHVFVGLLGMYLLARHYRLGRAAALVSAFVFNLSSMYALNLTVGMTWFMAVAYLPWTFLFYLQAARHWRYALASGACLTLMYFGGGVYPLAITLLFLAVYSLLAAFLRQAPFLYLVRGLAITLIFMLCLGAVKFLPSIEFQRQYPRLVYDYSGYSLTGLATALLSRNQTVDAIVSLPIEQRGFWAGVTAGMDENGMYIGLLPLALAVLGLRLSDRRRFALFVTLLIFLWLSFGNRPRAELWSLLHLLPVYNSMRIAQRFRIVVLLAAAIFAGFGYQWLRDELSRRVGRRWPIGLAAAAILAFILVDLVAVSLPIFRDAFPIAPLSLPRRAAFVQVWDLPSYDAHGWLDDAARVDFSGGDEAADLAVETAYTTRLHSTLGAMFPAYQANIGVINGYESANVPRKAVPSMAENYRGEVYLQDAGGTAAFSYWSPNRWVVEVQVESPGYLVVNQNFYPGWHARAPEPRPVTAVDGLLAVPVSPGDTQIELFYRPTSFVVGLAVSVLTVLAVSVFAVYQLRLFAQSSESQ